MQCDKKGKVIQTISHKYFAHYSTELPDTCEIFIVKTPRMVGLFKVSRRLTNYKKAWCLHQKMHAFVMYFDAKCV